MSTSSSSSSSKKTVSQKLVPFPPRQNRFSPLTPDKKLAQYSDLFQNKESKLIVPNSSFTQSLSPFSKKQDKQISQVLLKQESKPIIPSKTLYFINPHLQRIQILEDYQVAKLNQSFHILTDHLFGHGNTFYTTSYKTREYYQTILEESGSVKFTHRSNSYERSIDFSKAQIFKIISPEEWGSNLFLDKPLSFVSYPRYSYYDYQDAWVKVFFIRNYTHSWFIFWDLKFDYQYPKWFVNWFMYMGLTSECLPKEVALGLSKFKDLFTQEIPEFEYVLQFSMAFKIPWIMSWTYYYQEAKPLSPPWLNRQFRLKWWDKYQNNQANETAIQLYFQNLYPPTLPLPVQNTAQLPDQELVARIMSAAGSSAEQLQKLIQDIRSPTGSVKNELLQDAQDPFEDPYDD